MTAQAIAKMMLFNAAMFDEVTDPAEFTALASNLMELSESYSDAIESTLELVELKPSPSTRRHITKMVNATMEYLNAAGFFTEAPRA